jgi:CrcB protein
VTTASAPVHLRWRSVGLVFVGGALGTGLRYGLSGLIPSLAGVPVTILGINVLGAFVLGLLLEGLARAGPDDGWRQDVRLGVGTGVLGEDTASLLSAGHLGRAVGYAVGTLVLGLLAAAFGIWCGGRRSAGPG